MSRSSMNMTKVERWLTLSAALILGLIYFMPIWQLDIWAPQYPEGLSLTIWLSHMTGNLTQINLLNHYIGMKHITPSAIPELSIMPSAVLFLAGLGVLAAAINRRWAVGTWITIVMGAGLVGLYDFYRWGYDYGHNLDPHAAIQVPGMSYQPPLIGHKQLLNIDAYSYPTIGGILVGVAIALALLALYHSRFRKLRSVRVLLALFGLSLLGLSGCNTEPKPIEVGIDHCETCRMTIADDRFGGELITQKGKIYKFDSLDCLIGFYSSNASEVKGVFVSDFSEHGKLISADQAVFLRSEKLNAPMGRGLIASGDRSKLVALKNQFTGDLLQWPEVLKLPHSS